MIELAVIVFVVLLVVLVVRLRGHGAQRPVSLESSRASRAWHPSSIGKD